MRKNYLKELQVYKNKTLGEKKSNDVQYFHAFDNLDPEISQLLNEKVDYLHKVYLKN